MASDYYTSREYLQRYSYNGVLPRLRPVVVNGKVYVKGVQNGVLKVFEYTPENDDCKDLPLDNDYEEITLTTLAEQLVLISGCSHTDIDGLTSDELIVEVWDSNFQKCERHFPDCRSLRGSPAAIEHCNTLIFAGGFESNDFRGWYVEDVIKLYYGAWDTMTLLPVVDHYNPVLIEDTLYLIGCERGRVLRTCLSMPSLSWEQLADVPVPNHSSIVANGDTILTFGDGTVHFFNPHTNQWTKIGDFLTDCYSCTLLPSGELLVIGQNYVTISKLNLKRMF